jgi:hypothetical protein
MGNVQDFEALRIDKTTHPWLLDLSGKLTWCQKNGRREL